LELHKDVNSFWHIFIEAPSSRGIDPKSLFMIAAAEEAAGNSESSWPKYRQSADRGYFPAQMLVVDTLVNDINPYNVPKDEREAIRILRSIPRENLSSQIKILLAKTLICIGEQNDAKSVLEDAAEGSEEARLELVRLLETMEDRDGSISAQCVAHLEILQNTDNAEALSLLADHLTRGKGVRKDKERAKRLAKRAHEIDVSFPEVFEVNAKIVNVVIASSISLLFVGAVATFLSLRRRK
jgi:hypothetical protein